MKKLISIFFVVFLFMINVQAKEPSPYYSVLDVDVTDSSWGAEYRKVVTPLVESYGGRYLARTGNHEQLEGSIKKPSARVIIKWPTRQAALDFMKDPRYAPYLKARTKGSVSNHYLIEGIE